MPRSRFAVGEFSSSSEPQPATASSANRSSPASGREPTFSPFVIAPPDGANRSRFADSHFWTEGRGYWELPPSTATATPGGKFTPSQERSQNFSPRPPRTPEQPGGCRAVFSKRKSL